METKLTFFAELFFENISLTWTKQADSHQMCLDVEGKVSTAENEGWGDMQQGLVTKDP